MKYLILLYISITGSLAAMAQETIYPAGKQQETVVLTNATIHVGNGQVIEKGVLTFSNGKITAVGTSVATPAAGKVIDLQGKHVYPGIIAPVTNLGLTEVEAVRSTNDFKEVGEIDPSVRALVAYNTDSKVINTIRANGILLAQVTPEGGLISGSSSVVQLDAWNWEDAAYRKDGALHFYMPSLLPPPAPPKDRPAPPSTRIKDATEKIDQVRAFFRDAKVYLAQSKHGETNLKFEAVRRLFSKDEKLFIHCDIVKEMLVAVDFAKEFGFDVVIVGGADAWRIADILKQNNIAVVLKQPHALPVMQDDDVDQPYKLAYQLQQAGVLFCLSNEGFWQQRNLPFEAGTASAYGLSKEEALSAVTINAAKILGIDKVTGTLETGKDANITISTGDIMDMRSSVITQAFIQGREISLDNKHKQLYERYKFKYGLK
ncbi:MULTISPECIES: amidohydrolase family protein [unclassified Chitinophaga]|uniref:amidohydrolase family protein n=1 Tax=unclassified Chitinophaga TaxID=2619133 RepID=UPI0009C7E383|nr:MULTISPECIES: amidohydrolase family protein [unclassified Chitinophaga]OMP80675.1 amidohydrolase [[Flexibacter] sp. ATCC 35208]WPV69411.1 amidohydrolase family protein [Chitinophaga sp. LS1]